MTSTASTTTPSPLKFSLLTWHIDRAFWFTLSSLKLDSWKLDSSPKPAVAFYSTPVRPTEDGVSGLIEFNGGAFDESMYFTCKIRVDNRIPDGYAAAKGWTCNFNTVEEYRTHGPSTAKFLQDNVSVPEDETYVVVFGNDSNET
jgi:Ubiquitin-like modifier-activating enzyme ATG7 N-terminus